MIETIENRVRQLLSFLNHVGGVGAPRHSRNAAFIPRMHIIVKGSPRKARMCCSDANVHPDERHEDAICERQTFKSRRVEFPCGKCIPCGRFRTQDAKGRATGTRDMCNATSREVAARVCRHRRSCSFEVPLTTLEGTRLCSHCFLEAKQNG